MFYYIGVLKVLFKVQPNKKIFIKVLRYIYGGVVYKVPNVQLTTLLKMLFTFFHQVFLNLEYVLILLLFYSVFQPGCCYKGCSYITKRVLVN